MKIYDANNAELMTVRSFERDGDTLVIRGKIFGAMPMVAKLTPAEKSATWQAYQALPEAEKQKLAAKAAAQPSGAAPAISPTAPRKLASVPLPRQPAASSAKMAASSHAAEHTGPTSPSQPAADAPGIHKN